MHSIKIFICPTEKTLTLKLDMDTLIYDICRDLYSRISNNVSAPAEDFGLFVPDKDPTRAYWLDTSKPVCYYPLSDKNALLEFKSRQRRLVIRTMDGTRKTLEVDDSKTIAELLLPICNKMGVSNHEEYSLIHEIDEEERMKTMTLKKGKTQIRDFEKMEKMKVKLKTDDELNWLPHAKTLRQLGIDETDSLLLRRKYFFSDQNVDARDPIQLNLLYVQLRDAIILAAHPVSIEEAIQLAGIQCQAELGNCSPENIKQMHANLKTLLPKEYVKTKGIEKKIIQIYEGLSGTSDKEAKVKYAQLCRSLKTYGITFFLVKEKVRAKNKLVPRLMGISKEYVMRVDEKTKEIIQSWPLTTIRRYAATASLFSLDFGDYSEENYVIQTLEGEKIAQLIAGYIDIIIKKQKAKDKHSMEADEETAMIEENVAPSKANVISHHDIDANRRGFQQNSIATVGQVPHSNNARGSISTGHVEGPKSISINHDSKIGLGHVNAPVKSFEIRELTQPKRALMMRIGENLKILQTATEDLDKNLDVAKLGNDESARTYRKKTLDVTKNKIKGNLMSMTMATGNIISMVSQESENEEQENYGKIDTAVTTIGYNTNKMIEHVRTVYEITFDAVEENELGPDLVGAAKSLLLAFEDLLNASKPIKTESDQKMAQETYDNGTDYQDYKPFSSKSLLEAVNKVGEASRNLLQLVSIEKTQISEDEWQNRDMLLTDAKFVAANVSNIVKLVKEASVHIKELKGDDAQSALIHAAKHTGQATSMLISAAKVVACSPDQPLSQQQLNTAGRNVSESVDDVLQLCEPLLNNYEQLFSQMETLAISISENIGKMQQNVVGNTIAAHQDKLVAKFLSASERLPASMGNRNEMVTQAAILADVGSQLVSCLNDTNVNSGNNNTNGNYTNSTMSIDSDRQRRLLIATQALTDAVDKLVQSTKICRSDTEPNSENQQILMQAAQHMISVAHMTAGEIIRQRVCKGLEYAGRQTAMTADQLLVTSQEAVKSAKVTNFQANRDAQEMTDVVLPAVVLACSKIRENPSDSDSQNNLLNTCQQLIKSLEQLLSSSEALGPQVRDLSLQDALNISVQTSSTNLNDLKHSVHQAESVLLKPNSVHGNDVNNIENVITVKESIAHLNEAKPLAAMNSLMDSAAESIAKNELYPLPGETMESVSATVGNSSRAANKNLDDLYKNLSDLSIDLSDVNNDKNQSDLIKGARSLMDSMDKLLTGARGIAACKARIVDGSEERYAQQIEIINCGKQIIQSGEDVLQGVKLASVGAVSLNNVKESVEQMRSDIDQLVHKIPSYKELDDLISRLNTSMQQFTENCEQRKDKKVVSKTNLVPSKSHNQLQSEFTAAVAVFNQTLNDMMSTNGTYSSVSTLANQLHDSHQVMLETGSLLAAESPDNESQLTKGLDGLTKNSYDLLDQLKIVLTTSGVSPDTNLLKQDLLKAAGAVSDSINDLLSSCATTLPKTQQLCESSQRQLDALKSGLLAAPPSMPVNDSRYGDCVDLVDRNCEDLLSEMKRIPNHCKNSDSDSFSDSIRKLAASTNDMLKMATQANYQLGVVESAVPGSIVCNDPVDSSSIIDGIKQNAAAVHKSCINLSNEDNSELACRQLANDIKTRAVNTSQLVKQLIQLSGNSGDSTPQTLLDAGKQVAESAAGLIKTMSAGPRSLAKANRTPEMEALGQDEWTLACDKVSNAVDNLVKVATSVDIKQDLISSSCQMTDQGCTAQLPIHRASVDVADGSVSLLRAASSLVKDPASIPANQAYIINQKTFADSLRKLRDTVKYCSPGQQEFLETKEETKYILKKLSQVGVSNGSTSKYGSNIGVELQRIQSSLKQMENSINTTHQLVKCPSKYDYLGKSIAQTSNYLAPISESVEKLAVSLPHSRDRAEIVELTRTVLEAYLVAVQSCQDLTTNFEDNQVALDDIASLKEGCQDLLKFVDGIANCHGTLEGLIGGIQKSMDKVSNAYGANTDINGELDVANGHTKIVQSVRGITTAINELCCNSNIASAASGGTGAIGAAAASGNVSGVKLQKRESVRSNTSNSTTGTANSLISRAAGNRNDASGLIMTDSPNVKRLVHEYEELTNGVITVIGGSNSLTSDNVMDNQLRNAVLAIGQSSIDLIRYEQPESANNVRSRLADLMFTLQSSARGTQACITASNEINYLINDLDTAILFASSGTLTFTQDRSADSVLPQSITQIKEELVNYTKLLMSDLQQITVNVKGRQDELANAAESAVLHAAQLCNAVKNNAIDLGVKPSLLGLSDSNDEEVSNAQTLLLNAARDLSVSLLDFFNHAKCTSSANSQENECKENLNTIKNSYKSMSGSVESLIKSVKSLEDSGMRGTRALETALQAMDKEYKTLEQWNPDMDQYGTGETENNGHSEVNEKPMIVIDNIGRDYSNDDMYSPQNLVLMTKSLVSASQKAMTAVQTFRQEDMIVAANVGRKAIQDFTRHLRMTVSKKLDEERQLKPTRIFKDSVSEQSSEETVSKMIEYGKGAVQALISVYENLSKAVSTGSPSAAAPNKMQMTLASRRVTHAIHEVAVCATSLKQESIDETDYKTPETLAEEELNDAARQIEAAAKKLSQLKPKKTEKTADVEEDLTFDGQILVGCKSILSAMKLLMKSATAAQQELVRQGRTVSSDNSTNQSAAWSQGLISAAKLVAAATDSLCEAAHAVVTNSMDSGNKDDSATNRNKLVSAARQVASGTAHLLYACQVRADSDSQANRGLQAAGAAVRKATEALVHEATVSGGSVSSAEASSPTGVVPGTSIVSSMRSVIQAQAAIVAKEKELEMLRSKYNTIRQEHITTHPDYFEDN